MHQRSGDASMLALLGNASVEVSAALEAGEPWRLSDRQLVSGVDAAYRLVAQTQSAALALLGELDARDLAVEAAASSTAAWLTARRRMRPRRPNVT